MRRSESQPGKSSGQFRRRSIGKPATEDIDRIFAALTDQTRRAILARLTDGDVGVMDIRKPFETSQPTISRHIKVLETAGLITRHRQGTHRMCRLSPDGLGAIEPWFSMIANSHASRYNRLDTVLETLQKKETSDAPFHTCR